ncbi:MAG TPA: fimbria/pilus outer membrane usher protein [Vicinamibacterales bacterium]|nr:fimbria/pilus outer membrane usher protein [Vicinamibacterales bacterium]
MFALSLHRLASLCLLAFLLFPRLAHAQDQRAVLELVVNSVSAGESIVVLRGSDVLVSVSSLNEAGIRGFTGRRDTLGGQEFVSLASLAPDVTFSVDELELRLTLTTSPNLLGRTIRDLRSGAPADLVYRRDTSGFLNYSANWHSNRQFDLFAESATSFRGALIYNTVSASRQSAKRGLTSVTVDQRRQLRRWTLGDTLGYSGPLGGNAWIGGISVAKEFAIDPYYVRYPTLSLSTPIAVPSVMEVYVNGQIVSQERVAPGRLDVRNLPLTMGRNDARVVVRDAFGTTRELTSNYYLTTTALARGVQDYEYNLGFRRMEVGEKSWDYRTPVMMARHRVGITDSFTAGGRVEMHPGRLFSAGPSVNIGLPFGEIEAAASVSRRGQEWGKAGLTSFTYTGHPISAGGSMMLASRRYATLTQNPLNEDPKAQASLFASAGLGGPVSVTLQHSLTKLHQGISRERSGLLTSLHLSRNVELIASVTRARDEQGTRREIYAGLTVLFGRSSASVSHTRDSRGQHVAFEAQQPLPVGTGYGYQMRAQTGATDMLNGVARYQGAHGRYELRQETIGNDSTTTLSTMGSLVAIGGGLFGTRPVQESFALVRVPGVEGVRAFASHQEIGKTGRRGDLLVPDLQAYYGNILNIADGDIPLEYAVPDSGLTLAPPYRGGAVALFDVQRVQRVLGRIVVGSRAEERPQPYGELTVTGANGRTFGSPVGSDGAFYFENLPTGSYSGVVENRGTRCTLALEVPVSKETVIRIGTVRCTMAAKP